jgi:erythromycin esterase-like protein
MKYILFVIVLLSISNLSEAQSIKQYVEKNTSEIKSIDPNFTDDADLEVFGKAIGNARVVMLGEQDHGDAAAYLAKTRLIKYLHEQKGFNVLAFESDFWSLNYGWDNLPKNDPAKMISFLQQNIFDIWTACKAFFPLMKQYIPSTYQTKNLLQISGFDNQMVLEYSRKLSSYLDSVFRKYNLPVTHGQIYSTTFVPSIDSILTKYMGWEKTSAKNLYETIQIIDSAYNQLLNFVPDTSFNVLLLKNLQAQCNEYLNISNYTTAQNIRDKQMFENLKWLINIKYPGEKIIVWAASEHVSKYIDSNSTGRKRKSMGGYFIDDSSLLKQTYVLGFTSYQGEAGRQTLKKYQILKPWRNGFETWINPQYDYAFIDFKQFAGKKEKFHMQGLSHYYVSPKDWSTIFDGIFFIRNMYSCIDN